MKILASPKRVNPKLDETSRKVRGFEDILGEDISSAAYTRKVGAREGVDCNKISCNAWTHASFVLGCGITIIHSDAFIPEHIFFR